MKSALVTGSTGFLGRALAARLGADGVRVHLLLRPSSDAARVRGLPGRPRLYRSDGSSRSLRAILSRSRPEAVFHLAAAAKGSLDELVEANLLLGLRLADAAAESGVGTFVSAGTYWQRRETPEPDPFDRYAALKQSQEDALRWFASAGPLRIATVVLYDVYGPDDPRRKILSLLVEAARSGRALDLSPGRQRLELLHVDDAVSALLLAEKALGRGRNLSGSTWFAPSARAVTLREAASAVGRLFGPVPARWGAREYRPRETMRPWRGAPVPGWKPRVGLERGLLLSFGKAP